MRDVLFLALLILLTGCSEHSVATLRVEFRDAQRGEGSFSNEPPFAIALSADGSQVATGRTTITSVEIRDWKDPTRIVHTLGLGNRATTEIGGLRYSPDGRWLVAINGADGTFAHVWKAGTGELVSTIPGLWEGPTQHASVEFSPDGRTLVQVRARPSNETLTLIVYDTSTWSRSWGLSTLPFHPQAVAVSHDGRYAALAGDDWKGDESLCTLQIVDLKERRVVQTAQAAGGYTYHVVWQPDGRRVIAFGTKRVTLNMASGQITSLPVQDREAVQTVQYSPNGRYLMIATDTGVELWDGTYEHQLQKIGGQVHDARFSSDGRFLAIAVGPGVSIWEIH
jgi:WD40 repeat protein